MTLSRKGLVLFIAMPAVQFALSVTLIGLHRQTAEEARQIEQALRTSASLIAITFEIFKVKHLCYKGQWKNVELDQGIAHLLARLDALGQEFEDRPDRLALVRKTHTALLVFRNRIDFIRRRLREGTYGIDTQRVITLPNRALNFELGNDAAEIIKVAPEEQALIATQLGKQQYYRRLDIIVIVTASIMEIVLIVSAAFWFDRDVTRRIAALIGNTEKLARDLPLLPPVSGNDEITDLDKMFRTIADSVTSAAKSERDMVDKQRDMICRLNEKLQFIYSNQASTDVLGYSPEQLLEARLAQLVHADDLPFLTRQCQLTQTETLPPFEARIVHRDGRILNTVWSMAWSSIERSSFCVIRDITEQKKSERLRQEVLQMVGHDLKSPLTAVTGFLQLFETPMLGQSSPEALSMVEQSMAQANQMTVLIRDLLNLEMVHAGMLSLQCESLSLAALLSEAGTGVADLAAQFDISLSIAKTDLTIYGDKERFSQVFHDLLANAILRSGRGAKVLVLSEKLTNSVTVNVTDHGRMISSHEVAGIFEPFRTASEGVSGLSLAMCKAFVELHGGQLSVKTSVSDTTFAITMPPAPLAS